jgi:hypothetical protein
MAEKFKLGHYHQWDVGELIIVIPKPRVFTSVTRDLTGQDSLVREEQSALRMAKLFIQCGKTGPWCGICYIGRRPIQKLRFS